MSAVFFPLLAPSWQRWRETMLAVEDNTLAGEADTLADEANTLADEADTLADEALTLAWNYMLLLHRDERSLAEFGLSLQDIKSIGRTCSGARDAVTNDPCWQVDVFGRTDADVLQWPLFSPAELYDLGPGTVIWAWIEKKWYRGTLSLDASYDDQMSFYRALLPGQVRRGRLFSCEDLKMVAFDDGQLEPWRTVVGKCLQRRRLRVEKWNCERRIALTAGERSRIEEGCVALRQEIDAVRVPDPRSEKVLRLQEDLALLLSRLGRTDESRPMWRHLLRERLHFAPTRATKGRNAQERRVRARVT